MPREDGTRGRYPNRVIDSTPTKDSQNLVTSGGVYASLNANEERTEQVITNLPTDINIVEEYGQISLSLYHDGKEISGQTAVSFNAASDAYYIASGSTTGEVTLTEASLITVTKLSASATCGLTLGTQSLNVDSYVYVEAIDASSMTLIVDGTSYTEDATNVVFTAANGALVMEVKLMTGSY